MVSRIGNNMTPEQFTYWLRGFFELLAVGPKTSEKLVLTAEQVEMIDKHLTSIFQSTVMSLSGHPVITYSTPMPPYTVTCATGSGVDAGKLDTTSGAQAVIC